MFETLAAGLAECASEEVAVLPDGVLGHEVVELHALRDSLDAQISRRLALYERRQGFAVDGFLSIVSWLSEKCHVSRPSAAARAATARDLEHLPQTREAFEAGEIGYEHARVMSRLCDRLGREVVGEAEGILVAAARELEPGRLRIAGEHLCHYLDPDGCLAEANDQHERRRLHLSELNGMFVIDGLLDREGGACLRTALEAVLGPRQKDDERTPAQRRADALTELASRLLDAGTLPVTGGVKPHVSLLVSAGALAKQPGAEPAELQWAGLVTGETARRLACDCSLSVIHLDGDGERAGRASRTISPSLRRSLVARDRGCRFPGCDRPAAWTQGHHVQHWIDGGPSTRDNLALYCARHHRLFHEGGWRLRREANGELVAQPP
jgi:hypothetical protein